MTTDLTARLDADAAHAQQILATGIHPNRVPAVPWLVARLGERDAALRAVDAACAKALAVKIDGSTTEQAAVAGWASGLRAAVVSALSGGADRG